MGKRDESPWDDRDKELNLRERFAALIAEIRSGVPGAFARANDYNLADQFRRDLQILIRKGMLMSSSDKGNFEYTIRVDSVNWEQFQEEVLADFALSVAEAAKDAGYPPPDPVLRPKVTGFRFDSEDVFGRVPTRVYVDKICELDDFRLGYVELKLSWSADAGV